PHSLSSYERDVDPLDPLYLPTRRSSDLHFVIIFTLITVTGAILMGIFGDMHTGLLFGLPNGLVITIIIFVIAKFGFSSGNVFYAGMLSSLGKKEEIPLISGFGVALGYLGTLFGIITVMYLVGDAGI